MPTSCPKPSVIPPDPPPRHPAVARSCSLPGDLLPSTAGRSWGLLEEGQGKKGAQKQLREVLSCTLNPAAERSSGLLWPRCHPSSGGRAADHRQEPQPRSPAALQQLSSPRPSLGLSLSLCPIWRCLSLETLWGASAQDRAWQEMTGEEENHLHVHLRLCTGSEGADREAEAGAFPAWIFCTKDPSPEH